jgi:hypothetical protein
MITKMVDINTDKVCHRLCSYLHWINIPLSYYIYAYNPSEKYIFDIIGIIIFTISFYTYDNKDTFTIATNARSFLVVVTNYYNSQSLFIALFISGLSHIVSIKGTFLHPNNIIIPIACDVFLIYINSPTKIAIPFLLVNIIMGLLFMVQPLYKLTPVSIHILLIMQTYYMCLSNVPSEGNYIV